MGRTVRGCVGRRPLACSADGGAPWAAGSRAYALGTAMCWRGSQPGAGSAARALHAGLALRLEAAVLFRPGTRQHTWRDTGQAGAEARTAPCECLRERARCRGPIGCTTHRARSLFFGGGKRTGTTTNRLPFSATMCKRPTRTKVVPSITHQRHRSQRNATANPMRQQATPMRPHPHTACSPSGLHRRRSTAQQCQCKRGLLAESQQAAGSRPD